MNQETCITFGDLSRALGVDEGDEEEEQELLSALRYWMKKGVLQEMLLPTSSGAMEKVYRVIEDQAKRASYDLQQQDMLGNQEDDQDMVVDDEDDVCHSRIYTYFFVDVILVLLLIV